MVDGGAVTPNWLYILWFAATALALGAAWASFFYLRQRENFLQGVLGLMHGVTEGDDFNAQSRSLCEQILHETGASGATLYLQPGQEESGFRRAAQAGRSAEETGPGVVRDLLSQAWDSGEPSEAVQRGRCLLAVPVSPGQQTGGALLAVWDQDKRPSDRQRRLMETAALAAALLAPRFGGEGALARAKEEIASLQAEMAEESHLAGVGRLAAGVAHELNTPLGAVLAMVGSLSRTQAEPQVARRLEIMREAVEKCKAIIEKLLIYSRGPLEAEQGLTFSRFVRSELDLNRVIENSVELLKESLNQDGIRVKLDLHPLPTVRANSTQWAHVFNNLLVNARDALLSSKTYQPTVDIRTGTQNGQILVEVWDNGPGIPSEVQSKIFQPFYTTKEIGKGTGLGLAICKEVTRKHSGDIVAGTSDAGGAKFTITLPIQAPEN
ncbi:MAG: hypothetical protein AMXMBFR33_69640 [Candidatus Xenobia bacterium]